MKHFTLTRVCGLLLLITSTPLLATTIIVNDDNLGIDWFFAAEGSGTTGDGGFVAGPGMPPIGVGSAEFSLDAAADGFILMGAVLEGSTPLADIEVLSYSTYRQAGGSVQAVTLQFNMNYDPSDENDGWQGRLVFEPYYSETVLTGTWQTWDALTQGRWWATGSPGNTVCTISGPCTWDQVLTAFPDAEIRAEAAAGGIGLIQFKAGSGWAGFIGNVDGLHITIDGEAVTYDLGGVPAMDCVGFEPPMDKEVSLKRPNRVLPFKMQVFDELGNLQTDADITPPVIQYVYDSVVFGGTEGDELNSAGRGDEGNRFSYNSDDEKWHFNLSVKGFAEGSYTVNAVSGESELYMLDGCEGNFVIQ